MMNKRYNSKTRLPALAKATGVLILGLGLTACENYDMSDLNKFVAETQLKYIGKVEPLPVITPYESYTYQPDGKRDPFQPSVALVKVTPEKKRITRKNGPHPNALRNREELEKYPLSTLVMVGVMKNEGDNWAIIKAPDGSIFRVKRGNYMGENHGKILKITEAKIELKEIVSDGDGGWKERKNEVTLSE